MSEPTQPTQSTPLPADELQARVKGLELRSAFQERLSQELSDQVYELHKVIAKLREELELLKKRAEAEQDPEGLGPAFDPPPHY
jgi:uncharacterized coiled-coil protein SlyX